MEPLVVLPCPSQRMADVVHMCNNTRTYRYESGEKFQADTHGLNAVE